MSDNNRIKNDILRELWYETNDLAASFKKMKEYHKNQIIQGIKYQIAGWILFIICAIFFVASSLKNHDILAFIGSVIFFIACIIFFIPLVRSNKRAENDKN